MCTFKDNWNQAVLAYTSPIGSSAQTSGRELLGLRFQLYYSVWMFFENIHVAGVLRET